MTMTAGQEILRRAIIDRVEEWLAGSRRLFLLVGEPGAGKTIAARQIVAAQAGEPGSYPMLGGAALAMAHFCLANDERSLNPADFVASLSDGLARVVPGFAEARERTLAGPRIRIENIITQQVGTAQSGARITGVKLYLDSGIPLREAYAAAIRRPLGACDDPRRTVLVVVDDLSASLAHGSVDNTIAAVIRMVSAGGDAVPGWLRFLITSRPNAVALRDLDGARCDLGADLAHDELDEYVKARLGEDRAHWRKPIVETAKANFLVARHMVDDVLAGSGWASGSGMVPRSLSEIYQEWVTASRESAGAGWLPRFLPVLQVLAVARGAGLTLPQLAGITGLPRADVRDVLENMAGFLRTEGEQAQVSVYHDSFRDFLLATEAEPSGAHDAVVSYFVAASAGDWLTADRYAAEHLATHASACGCLAELIESPAFLAVAEPRTLVPALSGLATANARVYLATAWLLGDQPVAVRVSHLELAARSMRADALADSLADLPVGRSWKTLWIRSVPKPPGRILGQIPNGVLAMILIEIDGHPVLAAHGAAGGIWLLDLDGASDPVLLVGFGWASGLAGAVVDGRSVLLVADSERLALVEVPSKTITEIPAGDSLVTALALTSGPEGLLAITGHEDGSIQVLNLASMEVATSWQGHSSLVTSLAVEDHGDDLRVVSGSVDGEAVIWSVSHGGIPDSGVRLYQEDTAWIGTLSLMGGGTGTTVLGGTSEGLVFLAHHPSSEPADELWRAHEPAGAHDLFFQKEGGQHLTRTVTGRKVGFADIVEPGQRPLAIRGGVNSVAGLWSHDGPIVVTSGQDGKVMLSRPNAATGEIDLWELATSPEQVGPLLLTSTGSSIDVLYAEMGSHGAVVKIELAGPGGLLRPSTGDLPGTIVGFAGDGVSLVAALLSSGDIMVWDPSSGDLLGAPYKQKDFKLVAIATAAHGHNPVLAAVGYMQHAPIAMLIERPGTGPASKVGLLPSLEGAYAVAVTDAEAGTLLVGGVSREGGPGLTRLLPIKRSRWRVLGNHWKEQPIRFPEDADFYAVTLLRSLTIGPHTHVIACGSDYSIWIIPPADGSPPTLAYHFHWTADPVLARWHGRPALLVGSWDKLSIRRLDDPLSEQPVIDLPHNPVPDVITAIAALDVERLLVVGGSDGTITLWRDGTTTAPETIRFEAPVRHLDLCDDQTLLVSTAGSVTMLRIAPLSA